MQRITALLALIGLTTMVSADVQTTEDYLISPAATGYFNPSCAYAPDPDAPGFGDLVMVIYEMDESDSSKGVLLLRSADNGATWSEPTYLDVYEQIGTDRRKYGPSSIFGDPDTGRMVYFAQEAYYEDNKIASTFRMRRIVYRISEDNGHTWTDRIDLIQSGTDEMGRAFDETHWMTGAVYGRNMSTTIGGRAIKLAGGGPNKGKIILPFQQQAVGPDGKLIMPTWGGHYVSGCLIGTWNADATDLTWECSNLVGVSPKVSSRGAFEPGIAEFPDGRLVMVMRGSNADLKGVTGCRFISVSNDQGYTWSAPVPLLFDDVSVAKSSSSMALLIAASTGRVCYCGVITDAQPRGNWPRYPIVLAEIDPDTLMVKRDAVLTVVDRHGDDTANAQYANQWLYEDSARRAIVVLTPHFKTSVSGTNVDRHIVPLEDLAKE